MATIFEIRDNLAQTITGWLAPFQPNLPGYPNTAPTAGTIPATVCAAGYPVQYHVTERLENELCQVSIVEGKVEKIVDYFDPDTPVVVSGGLSTFDIARAQKQIIVEVWSYSQRSRETVVGLIRSLAGGTAFRQTESDGSVTLFRYTGTVPFDFEQNDSMWISQMFYLADYTVTTQYASAVVTHGTATVEVLDIVTGSEIGSTNIATP